MGQNGSCQAHEGGGVQSPDHGGGGGKVGKGSILAASRRKSWLWERSRKLDQLPTSKIARPNRATMDLK